MEKPVNTRCLSLHSFTSAGNNTKVTVRGLGPRILTRCVRSESCANGLRHRLTHAGEFRLAQTGVDGNAPNHRNAWMPGRKRPVCPGARTVNGPSYSSLVSHA